MMDGDSVVIEDILKRHKQEKKDLMNKIQGLKKSVPKGDKKKKKEITDEIANLEQELEAKHQQELNHLKENVIMTEEPVNSEPTAEEEVADSDSNRLSRAQKRRNKKVAEEKERQKRISEQAEKNKGGPRESEMRTIREVLQAMNRLIHNIPADGNCLYCAINHQLEVNGEETYTVEELRKTTAHFMLEHQEDFLPFMCNDDDDVEVNEEEFRKYCKKVASTKLWGGQLELKALSNIVKCPIKIIQGNGPPTVQGEGFNGPELILTYHRHLYRLGEHYNSTIQGVKSNNEDDDYDDDC